MDYNRLLFAYHARELAIKRVISRTPANLTQEARDVFLHQNFDTTLDEVIDELQGIANKIDATAKR